MMSEEKSPEEIPQNPEEQSASPKEEQPVVSANNAEPESSSAPEKDSPPAPAESSPNGPTETADSPTSEEHKDAAEKNPSLEISAASKKTEKNQSFAIQCLQYLSIGKYFLVLARKHPADWPGLDVPPEPQKPPEDFQINLKQSQLSQKIFVVNGTNEEMKDQVADFLKKLDLDPFFSRDQGNVAKAMEDKLNSVKIDFAIVILSADDFVYPKNGKPGESKLRAGQNIVFELGYLLGKFKRQNVFVLYYEQKSFLLPTGLNDVMYTAYDKAGHWRKALIQRLKLCGYPIDKKIDE